MSKTLKNKPVHNELPRSVGKDPITIVDQQPSLRKLRRRLRQTVQGIEKVSGGRALWQQFEKLIDEYCNRRDEAVYGLGFRQGFTAAHNESIRTVADSTSRKDHHPCPDLLRVVAIQSDQPTCARVASLLETIAAAIKPTQTAGPNVQRTSPGRRARLTTKPIPQRRSRAATASPESDAQ
jgi:hypothetical protein